MHEGMFFLGAPEHCVRDRDGPDHIHKQVSEGYEDRNALISSEGRHDRARHNNSQVLTVSFCRF